MTRDILRTVDRYLVDEDDLYDFTPEQRGQFVDLLVNHLQGLRRTGSHHVAQDLDWYVFSQDGDIMAGPFPSKDVADDALATAEAQGELEPYGHVEPRMASLHVAHDSGDGETVYHCPFCGSGAVFGRSDNTVECDFCQTVFSVQVQPKFPNMPQTINGQPVDGGQPGGPHTPPWQQDVNYTPPAAPDLADQSIMDQTGLDDPQSLEAVGYLITAEGVALPEDKYIRHLAFKHQAAPGDYPLIPDDQFNARIEALVPFTQTGSGYVRGVRDAIVDAKRFHEYAKNEYPPSEQQAEYWLLKGELYAKLITFEEFQSAVAAMEGRLL